MFNRVLLWALLDGRLRAPLGHGELVAEAAHSLDFIGLNYYTRDMVSFAYAVQLLSSLATSPARVRTLISSGGRSIPRAFFAS